MESDGEDLDIFEENENVDNAEGADDNGNAETETGVKVPVPKRIVRNPRLKFNPDRLCGERGIPVLADHFKNVKFKGAGHEKEDLDKLLSKLEHWTHRLFPSMKFEDCLQHIEKLGKKKPVQTCLRKIRLDMPILNNDFVNEEEDHVLRNDDPEPVEMDAFDRLLGESQTVLNSDGPTMQDIMDSNSFDSAAQSSYGPGQVLGSEPNIGLTDEQKKRIEQNKKLAIERRKARLAAAEENSCQSQSLTSEIFSSQNATTQQNSIFTSPLKSQENISSTTSDSNVEFCVNGESLKNNFSLLSNENRDGLELDDLIDLVDEDEPVSVENLHTYEPSSAVNVNTKNDIRGTISLNTGNLKLNDLAASENEEYCSNIIHQESETSKKFENFINKNAKEDVSAASFQNTEKLRLNDLMDVVNEEESDVVKNIASKEIKCAPSDTSMVNESIFKAHSKTCHQNVDGSLLDVIDTERNVLDKTAKSDNADDLAMESLLDIIDEESSMDS